MPLSSKLQSIIDSPELLADLSKYFELENVHRPVFRGKTRLQLTGAFRMVQNKTNWKESFRARISKEDYSLVDDAVTFFTGGQAHIVGEDEDQYEVFGQGYYYHCEGR